MSFDISSPSDRLDMEPDAPVQDWNGKLAVREPMPTDDRMFWIVTDEGEAHEVAYDELATLYLREPHWSRQDGESGSWTNDEILGWTHDREDAEEAARLLLEQTA